MSDLPAHEELDEADVNGLLVASLDLIRSMNKLYGAEKANELWEHFGAVLGKETQYKVFHLMLTGETPSGFAQIYGPIDWTSQTSNKVAAIKAVRAFTGMGLKEAKEAVETAGATNGLYRIKVQYGKYDSGSRALFVRDMQAAGIRVV